MSRHCIDFGVFKRTLSSAFRPTKKEMDSTQCLCIVNTAGADFWRFFFLVFVLVRLLDCLEAMDVEECDEEIQELHQSV
jgi:hypothetical protein